MNTIMNQSRRLLLGSEVLVHVRGVLGQLTKAHVGVFCLELCAHGILVEQVGTDVALGGVGVALILAATNLDGGMMNGHGERHTRNMLGRNHDHGGSVHVGKGGLDGVALGIVTGGRYVGTQLMQVAHLFGLGALVPRLLFFGGHLSVHGRRVLSELSERHARILRVEVVAHRVLVQQIRTQIVLGSVGISRRLLRHARVNLFSFLSFALSVIVRARERYSDETNRVTSSVRFCENTIVELVLMETMPLPRSAMLINTQGR